MTLHCQQCQKKLTRKRARIIDNKVLCSACVFPVYCKACGKPKGAKGFSGPECMCDHPTGHGAEGAHSAGQTRSN